MGVPAPYTCVLTFEKITAKIVHRGNYISMYEETILLLLHPCLSSDDRSLEVFRQKVEAATKMKSVLAKEGKPNCLIIDEIDGAPTVSDMVVGGAWKLVGICSWRSWVEHAVTYFFKDLTFTSYCLFREPQKSIWGGLIITGGERT